MATAAGLISPGLVSLVKRAQQLRNEMEENKIITIGSYDFNTFPRKNGTPLTTCKACSLDVLSHAWTQDGKKLPSSTDGLNNNNHQLLRPKSNYEDLKKVAARPAVYYSEGEEALSSTDFEEDFFSFDETMENLESLKTKPTSHLQNGNYSSLKRSLSDYQRPPLPPKKLTRSPSTEIANRVNKFEQLAKEGSPPKDDLNKGLWFYKDGLRSPTTPPPAPRSRSSSLSNSTTSLPISVQVSLKETPSALQTSPANIANNGQLEPKVITAALASSPKLFQKSERTVNLPAAFVLTTPKSSPPRTPRTPSPNSAEPSRPARKRTPPIPPPRTNSSLLKKIELEAQQNKMKPLDLNQKVDQNLKLDEILDICADFEKQIQAEQEELRLIAQQKLQEESNGSVQFGAISFFPSTPPLPAKRGSSPVKSPTSSHQWSPLNTLSPNRIKTNGSLPRETRRPTDFNGQSLSSQNDVMFTFENPGYSSPQSTLHKHRAASAADKSPYENYPLFRGSQSPRTQIRTILPHANTNGSDTTDYIMNGAGEDFYSNYKSKEQLYIEAKHVLNMVEPYTVSRNANGVSPPQTVPRKPPRSKHDPGLNVMRPPSQEANQRVLIGTHMIKSQKSPEQTLTKVQHSNGTHSIASDNAEHFKQDYQAQLQVVSTLKKQLNDLELIETEEINQLELERSLLNAEFDSETQKISKAKMKIALLKHKETRLSGIYEEFQKEFKIKLNEATKRMVTLEENLDRLQMLAINDHETDCKIQAIKEQLEIEKKTFEDMEFHQMEEAAHKETERDELLKEIKDLEKQVESHESTLTEIDIQQKELLKNVRNDTDKLELRRKQLTANLNCEKDKMKLLEDKIKNQKFQDLLTAETESETDDNESLNLRPNELDARLSRLALLDKTQQEINQISVATTCMSQQSPGKFYRISSQNMKIPTLSTPLDFDTLNSIGSENGSSSDVHTESCYGSSNDLTNGKSLSKSNGVTLKTPKDPESTSGSGPSPDFISRPMSEESSVWDADEQSSTQVRRRHNKIQQRPLTRYLPIRNENFDLRAHIESAGHQIDQCNQVILAPDSCRGYLHKLSGNHQNTSAAVKSFRSKWNKRWFVFDRHKRAIIYYSDKSETKAKGGVYFQSIEEVYVDHLNHVKSPNAKMTFCMKTAERTYFLMAPSPESMRIWVDVIFTGAEGYQEFQQL